MSNLEKRLKEVKKKINEDRFKWGQECGSQEFLNLILEKERLVREIAAQEKYVLKAYTGNTFVGFFAGIDNVLESPVLAKNFEDAKCGEYNKIAFLMLNLKKSTNFKWMISRVEVGA